MCVCVCIINELRYIYILIHTSDIIQSAQKRESASTATSCQKAKSHSAT